MDSLEQVFHGRSCHENWKPQQVWKGLWNSLSLSLSLSLVMSLGKSCAEVTMALVHVNPVTETPVTSSIQWALQELS